MSVFHICQVLLYSLCNRHRIFRRANGENVRYRNKWWEEGGAEDCFLTNAFICMTATGKLNTESELLALLCICVLMGLPPGLQSVAIISSVSVLLHVSHANTFSFFVPPGQIQDVSLSQEDSAHQVEVTPELDLEVVPESSADWHNVFP